MEIEKIEDVMLRYVSNYGSRSRNKEKKNCLLYISETFDKKLGYPVTFSQMGEGWGKIGVAIAGNLKKADNVLIVPLDTPKKTYMPNFRYYPTNDEKAKNQELWSYTVNMLLSIIFFILGATLTYAFSKSIIVAVLAGWACYLVFGVTRHSIYNFTKSSASLAVVTHMAMRQANSKGTSRNAYVFVDHCSEDRAGLDMFLSRYADEVKGAKNIIYLDCIASGSKLVAAGEMKLDLTMLEDELWFDHAPKSKILQTHPELVFIFTAENEAGDWYVKNTRSSKDQKVDMKRLKRLEEALLAL